MAGNTATLKRAEQTADIVDINQKIYDAIGFNRLGDAKAWRATQGNRFDLIHLEYAVNSIPEGAKIGDMAVMLFILNQPEMIESLPSQLADAIANGFKGAAKALNFAVGLRSTSTKLDAAVAAKNWGAVLGLLHQGAMPQTGNARAAAAAGQGDVAVWLTRRGQMVA